MFSLFKKDPAKKLNAAYKQKLEQAMYAQRNGDIHTYSMITAEAEEIREKIVALENSTKT
ncbi:DUF6435 family protein [Porticoccus sp.]